MQVQFEDNVESDLIRVVVTECYLRNPKKTQGPYSLGLKDRRFYTHGLYLEEKDLIFITSLKQNKVTFLFPSSSQHKKYLKNNSLQTHPTCAFLN